MRIFIIGDRLSVGHTNDLHKILGMMGHESDAFFPPADLIDIIQEKAFGAIFDRMDKSDLVIGLGNLGSSDGVFYGYAIGREKRLLTEHKLDGVLPNTERVVGIADIIQWVVNVAP